MNKLMIAFGLLLVTGLSFACLWQYDWQSPVWGRYGCHYDMASDNYNYAALYMYYNSAYVSWTDISSLYGALYNMGQYRIHMCSLDDYSPPAFKADMLNYNGESSAFNMVFNAVLRTYFAHADASGKSYVLSLLQTARGGYYSCVNPTVKVR